MSEAIRDIAKQLLRAIGGPAGSVNVLTRRDEAGRPYFVVRIAPGTLLPRLPLPEQFRGYAVIYERRRPATALVASVAM